MSRSYYKRGYSDSNSYKYIWHRQYRKKVAMCIARPFWEDEDPTEYRSFPCLKLYGDPWNYDDYSCSISVNKNRREIYSEINKALNKDQQYSYANFIQCKKAIMDIKMGKTPEPMNRPFRFIFPNFIFYSPIRDIIKNTLVDEESLLRISPKLIEKYIRIYTKLRLSK
jgi:hypothetical protein